MRINSVKRILRDGGVSIGTMMMEFATTGIGRIAAEAGAEFAVFDMEHTGWSIETIRMLMATSRRPTWCRWCASRRSSITSSPGCSTSVRWGSSCRWSPTPRRRDDSPSRRSIRPTAAAALAFGDRARRLPGRRPRRRDATGQRGGHGHRPDRDGRRRRGSRGDRRGRGDRRPVDRPVRPDGLAGHPGPVRSSRISGSHAPRRRRLSDAMARSPCSDPATRGPRRWTGRGFRMLVYLADVWIYQQALRLGMAAARESSSPSR